MALRPGTKLLSDGLIAAQNANQSRSLKAHLSDHVSIRNHGTADNWSQAFSQARAANGVDAPIELPGTGYGIAAQNFYSSAPDYLYKDALFEQVLLGTEASPTTRQEPIIWIEKTSSADRDLNAGAWDQGAAYLSLRKKAGAAFAAAVTTAADYLGGSGDLVAIHARTRLRSPGGQGFAGWFYTDVTADPINRGIGIEVDLHNNGAPLTWLAGAGAGAMTTINAVASGSYGAHQIIRFPDQLSSSGARAWTGIQIGQNSIQPTDGNGNGEAIRVRGASYTGGRYGGITIADPDGAHYLTYGLRMLHADIANNAAVWLKDAHRIIWGTSVGGAGRSVTMTAGPPALFNISNAFLGVNGTKVVGAQAAAIANAASGTEVTTINAVLSALRTHGLIAT